MYKKTALITQDVALLAEGVDRNFLAPCPLPMMDVALLAEGVDRNTYGYSM